MQNDPIMLLAMQRAISDSADIEAQLSITSGCRPIVSMLMKARKEAALALSALALADAEDRAEIRKLQNQVARFDNLVTWLNEIVQSGFDADQEITANDREELIDILTRTQEGQEEAQQLGLIHEGATNDA